jgi:hypothetical protein
MEKTILRLKKKYNEQRAPKGYSPSDPRPLCVTLTGHLSLFVVANIVVIQQLRFTPSELPSRLFRARIQLSAWLLIESRVLSIHPNGNQSIAVFIAPMS